MKIMMTFPGQGAQVAGMLHQLPDNSRVKALLTLASDTLAQDVLMLDTSETLQHTRAVQLCLLIAGVAWAQELQAAGITPDFVAGLSIGAYPAAVVAGAVAFEDAVALVALRGELMENAWPQGYGLSVITGLLQHQVEALITQVHSSVQPVYLANINAEDQFVIAGSETAMAATLALARKQGAAKTHRLNVSVPSHCTLLADPARQLLAAMQSVTFTQPRIGYLSGSSGRRLYQSACIAHDLALNMAHQVRWYETMQAACERGVQLMIEIPPGATLTGLSRKVMTQGEAVSCCQLGVDGVASVTNHYRMVNHAPD
ncbi:malonate decarboxylase subunit epsilon [Enterobacteriaceae bacterium LUAb1]